MLLLSVEETEISVSLVCVGFGIDIKLWFSGWILGAVLDYVR